ncbi:MAG TPA: dihydrofolate reductase family protein [Solirubrobacteraceae bacterium]|nr:dihydrofolate reductase family protein [Solirubrobacteraceae bacterium]
MYERGRPDYPPALVERVVAALGVGPGARLLDLGAGTGKLSRPLLAAGFDVVAVEPLHRMRAALAAGIGEYVASRTLREPLDWSNSTLLPGDAVPAIARMREHPGDDLVVLGSGELVQALMRADLVDEYVLPIHPLVLGRGRRLFEDGGAYAELELVGATTTTGVVIATYRPTRSAG